MELDQLEGLDVPEGPREFSLPAVVVREILENLSSADLLNLSLVNKVWHYEALSVLRDRGSLTAMMNTDDGRCKDLRVFASDLRQMKEARKVIPFSGLTIAISGADGHHGDWCQQSSAGEIDQIYEDILRRMDFKHLALDLSPHSARSEDCAGFQLVKKILKKRSSVLEEFSLHIEPNNRRAFIKHFLQDCQFSSMTTLKFQRDNPRDEDLIKMLVSRCPNLKILSTDIYVNLKSNLLEGCAAGVVHAIDAPFHLGFNDEIPESAVSRLRLRCIRFWRRSSRPDFNLQKFDRMTRMMLQTSRSTLSSIYLEAIHLVSWNYGIPLRNVRSLNVLLTNFHASEPRFKRLFKSFDFSHVFPNLSSIKISYLYDLMAPGDRERNAIFDMAEQGNAGLIPPVNPTGNIKKLSLQWDPFIPDSFTQFLVQVFPHVEKLVIETDSPSLFARFWDRWEELQELDFTLEIYQGEVVENLDSAICGIFPQEVAQLRERDEEYLQSVNIVPVMPSLGSFKRLRTLNIFFCELDRVMDDPTSTISKVSGLIAFKRCPGVTVTLDTNRDSWRRALLRMEPYASVRRVN